MLDLGHPEFCRISKQLIFLAIQETIHFRQVTKCIDVSNGWLVRENACEPASQPNATIALDKNVSIHFAVDKIVPRGFVGTILSQVRQHRRMYRVSVLQYDANLPPWDKQVFHWTKLSQRISIGQFCPTIESIGQIELKHAAPYHARGKLQTAGVV